MILLRRYARTIVEYFSDIERMSLLWLMHLLMAIAYGLLFATVLALIFIPSLYMVTEDNRVMRKIRWMI